MRTTTAAKFEAEHGVLEREYEKLRREVLARFAADQQAAEQALQDAHWEAVETSDAARGGLNVPLKEIFAGLDSRWQELEHIHQQAVTLLNERGHWDEFPEAPPPAVILEEQPGRRFCHALEQAQAQFRTLSKQWLPHVFRGVRPLGILLLLWLLAIGPSLAVFDWRDWHWAAMSGGFAAVVGIVAGTWIHVYRPAEIRRRPIWRCGAPCSKPAWAVPASWRRPRPTASGWTPRSSPATRPKPRRPTRVRRRHGPNRTAPAAGLAARPKPPIPNGWPNWPRGASGRCREIEDKGPSLAPPNRRTDTPPSRERLRQRHDQALEESQRRFEHEWNEMANRWWTGIERFRLWADRSRAGVPRGVSRLEHRRLEPLDAADGHPAGGRLRPQPRQAGRDRRRRAGGRAAAAGADRVSRCRSCCPFRAVRCCCSKAGGPGRARAVDLMQSAMLRLLTAMPPGKVRFTIIDPVGLGDNFSAFMHLADFDEQLVASRIWTDTGHIEQRLADLTKHMENVIQVYLRKEFHSIEEYNAFAGEMAEPYRVLVVANFPANFSEAAVQRIKSIVASGARCGVFVHDERRHRKRPCRGTSSWPTSNRKAMVLRWAEGHFVLGASRFRAGDGRFRHAAAGRALQGDRPRRWAARPRNAGRVEVPFSCIIPPENEWWTTDSRAGIDVPLGRAGAMKLQHLDLGHGTSQHVLISGKTGSGKSTLLHVLITNLALRYSPDEVELYLVDFKKGVEFKAYARAALPHARVVAIESEREFGLSVLQRLDAELRTRGDLFRKRRHAGREGLPRRRARGPPAANPADYRRVSGVVRRGRPDRPGVGPAAGPAGAAGPGVRHPRPAGLADARRGLHPGPQHDRPDGRAHRLAVQRGRRPPDPERRQHGGPAADPARRGDLQRRQRPLRGQPSVPGRLAARQRSRRISAAHQRAGRAAALQPRRRRSSSRATSWPTWATTRSCTKLLAAPRVAGKHGPTAPAWLGSAVAIKDPTAAVFLRQNGSNLLMVGHREEAALGVLAACFISSGRALSPGRGAGARASRRSAARRSDFTSLVIPIAQSPPRRPGSTSSTACGPTRPEVGFWNRLAAGGAAGGEDRRRARGGRDHRRNRRRTGRAAAGGPRRTRRRSICSSTIWAGSATCGRRTNSASRRGDEGKPPSPAKQFAAILREGPPLGIHTLIWCDTYSNVTRMLDRQSMQDFEMRVLFQMNANDSSSLMDSPEASRLGVHRAIFYDEGQGLVEKFRPYGLPSAEWLAWVKRQFEKRGQSELSGK